MSVLTINNSSPKLEWHRFTNGLKKKEDPASMKDSESFSFVSDFTSPADEAAKKTNSKNESVIQEKKKKPFSYTSENWIG